jgi:hypothetical protein
MEEQKRRESNRDRVLALLQAKREVTNADLLAVGGFRYGARLFELRRMGHVIETIPGENGLFKFVLRGVRTEQPGLFEEMQ